MSDSVDKNIYSSLKTSLMLIQPANGYTNAVKSTFKGARNWNDVPDYPAMNMQLNFSRIVDETRGGDFAIMESDLLLEWMDKTANDTEVIADSVEVAIQDVKFHFANLSPIDAAYKHTLASVVNENDERVIQSVKISNIIRSVDYKDNKVRILFILKIKFLEII